MLCVFFDFDKSLRFSQTFLLSTDLDEINEYEMQRSPSPQEHLLNGVPVNGYHEPLSSRHYPEDDSVKFNIRGKVRGK